MSEHKSGLSVCCFGFAFAVWWGLSVFVMGMLAWLFGYGNLFVESIGTFYVGYTASFFGTVIGTVWGFVDGFISGVVFAWFYNFFLRMGCCKKG